MDTEMMAFSKMYLGLQTWRHFGGYLSMNLCQISRGFYTPQKLTASLPEKIGSSLPIPKVGKVESSSKKKRFSKVQGASKEFPPNFGPFGNHLKISKWVGSTGPKFPEGKERNIQHTENLRKFQELKVIYLILNALFGYTDWQLNR